MPPISSKLKRGKTPPKGFHPKTRSLLASLRAEGEESRSHVCVACGDTGKNSRGGPCYPCLVNGRVK
jgi:hypothetical protein